MPIAPYLIANFIAYLHHAGKAFNTIQSHLTAIGTLHKLNSFQDPTKGFCIARTLRGIKQIQPKPSELLPITHDLMLTMVEIVDQLNLTSFDKQLLKTIMIVAYHGCFRVGELLISSTDAHTLKLKNVAMARAKNALSFTLDSYKHTDSPTTFIVKAYSVQKYCPVESVKIFLQLRPASNSEFFFIRQNGKPAHRLFLANNIKACLERIGKDSSRYNTHSFRAGRATDLALAGTPHYLIKLAGRWHSDAYMRYIRVPNFTLPSPPCA